MVTVPQDKVGVKRILDYRGVRLQQFHSTVQPVYNDHSRDQVMMVSVDRWSLYRGALVSLKWPMDQHTLLSVDRWSLYTSDPDRLEPALSKLTGWSQHCLS